MSTLPQFGIGDVVRYPSDDQLISFTIIDITYCKSTDTYTYVLKNEDETLWVSSVSLRFYNIPFDNKNNTI